MDNVQRDKKPNLRSLCPSIWTISVLQTCPLLSKLFGGMTRTTNQPQIARPGQCKCNFSTRDKSTFDHFVIKGIQLEGWGLKAQLQISHCVLSDCAVNVSSFKMEIAQKTGTIEKLVFAFSTYIRKWLIRLLLSYEDHPLHFWILSAFSCNMRCSAHTQPTATR